MAVVRGSKQEKMIVVPYRPWKNVITSLGVLVCLTFFSLGAYFLGHNKGMGEGGDARIERDRLSLEIGELSTEVSDLRQEAINDEQLRLVNRQALGEVQAGLVSLRGRNAQLEEDVLFYKQIMSPENDETGLVIGQIDLLAADNGIILYRIEFKQLLNNDNFINGFANVNVLGVRGGEEVSLPLRSMSEMQNELDIKLQFKYFQNIEGELMLPEGFKAEKIQILAVSESDDQKTVQKSFSWLVEE